MKSFLLALLVVSVHCAPRVDSPERQQVSPGAARAIKKAPAPVTATSDRSERSPLRVGREVVAPVVIKRVDPDWSKLPPNFRYSGIILIEAVIDEHGVPGEIRVLKGQPELAQRTVEAMKRWRFRPGTLHGKPVPVIFNMSAMPHFRTRG